MPVLFRLAIAFSSILFATHPARADTGSWSIETRTVDDDRVIVLVHPLPEGARLEVSALHVLRRVFATVSADAHTRSTEVFLPPDTAERRAETRAIIEDMTASNSVPARVLESFDTGYSMLEARMAADPLPDVQAWQPGIIGAEIVRSEPTMKLTYKVDAPTGRIEIVVPGAYCNDDMRLVVRDAPVARASIESAVQRELDTVIAACKLATTSAYWMTGFDAALARAETRFAAQRPPR